MSQKFTVKQNDKVGRYAVATSDLEEGAEVLSELPFSLGPKAGSPVLCLGCLSPVDATARCYNCRWPVCGAACSKRPEHAGECAVFSAAKAFFQDVEDPTSCPCPQYECVTPLRTLLGMERDPARWEAEVRPMQSHGRARAKHQPLWQAENINVVNYIRDACKIDRWSEELIHDVCGILEVNCFEVITEESFAVRGLYPQAAILSHNCVANTCHTVVPLNGYRMSLRTTVKVKAGEELYSSYTGSLQPTLIRRESLRYSKYFECKCPRCADPTELGTHMSTLKCTKCDPGVILSSNPLDRKAMWKCSHCEFAVTGHGIKKVLMEIKNDMNKLEELEFGPERLQAGEHLLKKYRSVLHPGHALLAELHHSLIPLYGRVEGYTLDDLPDILLERKAEMCAALLKLLNVIEPGLTRIRGLTLYEYHVVLLMYTRSRFQAKTLNKTEFKKAMEEVEEKLTECVKILKLEPPTCAEGILGAQAAMSLQELRQSIASIDTTNL